MSDKNFKVKNGLTIQGTTDTLISADNSGGLSLDGTVTADSFVGDGSGLTGISSYLAPTLGSTSVASGATVTTIAGLTLTSPIVNTPTLTLSTTTSTTEGVVAWNATEDKLVVGDGSTAREFASSTMKIDYKTSNYTLVITDKDKMIRMGNMFDMTLTVPPNSSVPFPIGTQIHLLQTGGGRIVATAGSGVSVYGTPGTITRTSFSSATLLKYDADTWVMMGDLTA
jgi:hypothetical protein